MKSWRNSKRLKYRFLRIQGQKHCLGSRIGLLVPILGLRINGIDSVLCQYVNFKFWRNILVKSNLLKEDALKIAKKLGAIIDRDGPHQNASFYYDGLLIFEFGIRHGKRRPHGHLVGENNVLHLSETRAIAFARCSLKIEEYIQILRGKGVIPQ
jgi:hypothetical protein